MASRAYRSAPTDATTFYPRLIGRHGAVAGNSYLSVNAGVDVLKAGGNAIDAAVAACFVEGLVNPQMHTIGGECPILLRSEGSDYVVALNGNMAAPARATPEEFRRRGLDHVPDEDILAAGVPAAFGALLTALERYGTMPLREAIAPAIELARDGFPASQGLVNQEKYGLKYLSDKFERWPASKTLYMPVPEVGALVKNEALARTYDYLANAKDPHEAFYRGEIAAEIVRFSRERGGLLERADLEGFQTRVEGPVSLRFGEATIYKCGFWSQGPAMLQALAIMRRFDLRAMGPSSAWIRSAEVIGALGFPLSTRMMTFYLGPANHPNVVAPGKRPRTTLTPSLAFRRGKPWMTFGTMGGDQQEQWSLQFILYREAFGMTIQEAIEAPKLSSDHFPGFFAPHDHAPNHVRIEARFGAKAIDELRRRGHAIEVAPDWTEGFISAAQLDEETRLLEAGCDPRGSKSECFPAFAYVW